MKYGRKFSIRSRTACRSAWRCWRRCAGRNDPFGYRDLLMRSLLIVLSLAFASTARADSLDDLANAELKKQKIPGMALAVIHKGEVVKAQGYGFANVEHQVPVKRETVFQSGSVGKQFTAFLAMLLVEEGKLKLDEPVSSYLE